MCFHRADGLDLKVMKTSPEYTVYFLDDDVYLLNAVKRKMRKKSFSCRYFQTPESMLDQAGNEGADLLVSDINIPGSDIPGCLKRFRKICSGSSIILLTGDRDSETEKQIRKEIPVLGTVLKTDNMVEEILSLNSNEQPRRENESVPAAQTSVLILDKDIKSLIPGFLKEREALCHKILKDLDSGHFREIRESGHKIKGSGRLYGFDEISRLGALIEGAAEGISANEIRRAVTELLHYLKTVSYSFH